MFSNPLNSMVAVAMFALTAFGAYNVFHNGYGEPLRYVDGHMKRTTYNPGDPVEVDYSIVRSRSDCRAEIERYVIRASDNAIVWRGERAPANVVPASPNTRSSPSIIEVPRLPVGDYYIASVTVSECNDGFHVARAPLIKFRVGVTND